MRFVQYSRPVIEQAPLKIYLSALMFAPKTSEIRKQFKSQQLHWMKHLPDVKEDCSVLLQTLEGHTGRVNTIAFTQDGKVLASGSCYKTIRLWDPPTGRHL
jgi:WD40 repeat protein